MQKPAAGMVPEPCAHQVMSVYCKTADKDGILVCLIEYRTPSVLCRVSLPPCRQPNGGKNCVGLDPECHLPL